MTFAAFNTDRNKHHCINSPATPSLDLHINVMTYFLCAYVTGLLSGRRGGAESLRLAGTCDATYKIGDIRATRSLVSSTDAKK